MPFELLDLVDGKPILVSQLSCVSFVVVVINVHNLTSPLSIRELRKC